MVIMSIRRYNGKVKEQMNRNMRKGIYKWLLAIGVVFGMAACDEQGIADIDDLMTPEDSVEVMGEGLQISDVTFSDDHKVMELSTRLLHDVGDYDLTDSSLVVARPLQQVKLLSGALLDESQPIITQITNISREMVAKLNLRLLVLVDLSLSQSLIDEERKAVREIRTLFGEQNLYLSFMQGDNVSETYQATDYVINNYFVHKDPNNIFLYRSMLAKLAEFQDKSTLLGSSQYKVMLIMSNGKTYEEDKPIDPKHFEMQQQLADKVKECKGKLLAYYSNFDEKSSSNENADSLFVTSMPTAKQEDANILQYFIRDLEGIYQTSFNWPDIESDILEEFNVNYANYKIVLEQPDKKVFRGSRHNLQISFYDTHSGNLVVTGSTFFYLGSVYNPVIVRGGSLWDVIVQGAITALVIFLLVWLILQLLEPYIRYLIFKHKYVKVYGGNKMSFGGQQVAETCYYCKAPFEEGDEIVTKCHHTMHKHCWDENEYHCPEHGRHCKEGSHYYNSKNLYDYRNALFYMKWVLLAIVAGFIAWLFYTSMDHPFSTHIVERVVLLLNGLKEGTKEAQISIGEYASRLGYLPAFGLYVSFFVTLFLSILTVRRRQWVVRIIEMVLRSIFAGVFSFISCLVGCMIPIALHMDNNSFIVDWIPWALMSCVIMFAITYNTRIRIQKLFLVFACLVGFLSMFIWAFVYSDSTIIDIRVALLMSFITYAVGIAVCIAHVTPRSERYFLHVEGAIKEMDIALYKWMRASPNHVVTIGRSVDCSIQLSWDLNGTIAPLQAEIRQHVGSMRLSALEDGVMVDDEKPLPVGRQIWLYHGRSFTIGNTTFTYIEKDL